MKHRFIAAVVLVCLLGTFARAELWITSSRTQNDGSPTDTVQFFVEQVSVTPGFPYLAGFSVALFDSTPLSSGMYVTTNALGKVDAYRGSQSHLFTYIDPAAETGSLSPVQPYPHVVNSDGSVNQSGTGYATNSTVQVLGIGGTVGDVTGVGIDISSGRLLIAQAVVPRNDTVTLLQTTPGGDVAGNRLIYPNFEPFGTEFLLSDGAGGRKYVQAANVSNSPYMEPVPEPAALLLVPGIGWALLRRRRP